MLTTVFGKAVWDRRLSMIYWLVGTAVLTAFLVAFYPTIRDSPAMQDFLEEFPPAFLSAFGIDPATFTTGYGYVQGELYSLVAPIVAIAFAVGMGSAATAAEEEAGTMDQLLSLPIRRDSLVTQRIFAQVLLLAVLMLAFVFVLLLGNLVVDLQLSVGGVLGLNLGLMLLGLFFGTISAAVGAWRGKTSWAQGAGAGLAVASFFIYGFAPLVPALEGLEKFTPFYWFLAGDPLLNGPTPSFLLLGAGSVLFAVAAALLFRRRDIRTEAPLAEGIPAVLKRSMRRPSSMLRSVYGKTAWERRRSVWGWMGGMTLIAVAIIAFYPSIAGGGQDAFAALMEAMPPELLALFGITDPSALLTGAGFVSSRVYSSVGLILMLIFTIGMGTAALAGEEDKGTADLLLAHPLARRRTVTKKFLAMFTLVAGIMVGLFAVIFVGNLIVDLEITIEGMVAANVGLALISLLFGSVALAVGAWKGRPGLATGMAGGLAIALFFLNGLAAAVDPLEGLRPLSPFYWYLGESTPLATGFSAAFWLLAAGVVVFLGLAVILFRRRDIAT
ncbi:MAG: ABC transporter permease subunit [Acidimicrobiia bacterium]